MCSSQNPLVTCAFVWPGGNVPTKTGGTRCAKPKPWNRCLPGRSTSSWEMTATWQVGRAPWETLQRAPRRWALMRLDRSFPLTGPFALGVCRAVFYFDPLGATKSFVFEASKVGEEGMRVAVSEDLGTCQPCVFHSTKSNGCARGTSCRYCHSHHEIPRRSVRGIRKHTRERIKQRATWAGFWRFVFWLSSVVCGPLCVGEGFEVFDWGRPWTCTPEAYKNRWFSASVGGFRCYLNLWFPEGR